MLSDEEPSLSEYVRETQFVPRDDDAETLWEVIEIMAEKGRMYKVKWAGVDPKTKKPWAASWVPKRDCTDSLVLAWKQKQTKRKQRAEKKKGMLCIHLLCTLKLIVVSFETAIYSLKKICLLFRISCYYFCSCVYCFKTSTYVACHIPIFSFCPKPSEA